MRAAVLGALMVAACPAFAEEELDCSNAMAQIEMNQCAWLDFEKADEELNAVYKTARASTREMDKDYEEPMKGAEKALIAGQRGWVAYRDGHCELYGWEAHGGSMEPMLVSGCMAELTRARTRELKEFVDGPQ